MLSRSYIDYYFYIATLLLLLFAVRESFIEFRGRMRAILAEQTSRCSSRFLPHGGRPELRPRRLIEQRVRRAADKTVLAAAIFTLYLLLVNLVLVSLWPLQTSVNSTATALENTTNAAGPNNTRYWMQVDRRRELD